MTINHPHINKALMAQPWLIQPESLEGILAIAGRLNETPEAVEARLGRKLENTRAVTVRDGVAIVPVTGPIFRYANLFTQISGATSIQQLATDFTAALDDKAVKAIVLEIDSPGGQVTGIQEFADMVAEARNKKPIAAYVGGYGASAAYWIAAAASEMIVAETALLGSIGVVTEIQEGTEPGTVQIVSSQSPNKRPDLKTDEGKAEIQRTIDSLADVFIGRVAQFRGVDTATVMSEFGQGSVFVGAEAVKRGMADKTGSLEGVIQSYQQGAKPRKNGGKTTMDLTQLKAEHPDLVAHIETEAKATGYAEGKEAGAVAERERIQAVEAQSMPGHEDLIASLKFDGKTTGPEAAVQVLGAEKKNRTQISGNLQEDAPKPIPQAEAVDTPSNLDALPLEERCQAKWDKDPKVKEQFGDFKSYLAFEKHAAKG